MPLEFLSLLCLSSYTGVPQWLLLGRICLINPIPKLLLVRMRKLTRAVGHRVDKICPSWKLEFKSFQFINFSQKPCTVQGSLWWSLSQRHHQRLMSEGSVRVLVVDVMEPLGATDFLKEVLRTGFGCLYPLPTSCSLSASCVWMEVWSATSCFCCPLCVFPATSGHYPSGTLEP